MSITGAEIHMVIKVLLTRFNTACELINHVVSWAFVVD